MALDPETAFTALSATLCSEVGYTGPPLEIELLPSSACVSSPSLGILTDQHCVGIPKSVLRYAFLWARKVFFSLPSRKNSLESLQGDNDVKLLQVTAVMLLFDPEYVSAANARKRYLQNLICRSPDTLLLSSALQQEIWLLETLVTSHLNRHTKSPTLWAHRHWLYRTFSTDLFPSDTSNSLQQTEDLAVLIEREMRTVMRSGDLHPKNYYAWDYARRFFRLAMALSQPASQSIQRSYLTSLISIIHDWCLVHPTDTSGWSFLTFLLLLPPDGNPKNAIEPDYSLSLDFPSFSIDILGQVIERALTLRWKSECVWNLVRVVLVQGFLSGREQGDTKLSLDCQRLLFQLVHFREDVHDVGSSRGTAAALEAVEKVIQWVTTRVDPANRTTS